MSNELSRRSLYEQIAAVLREEVLASEPGHRLETDHVLARRFSVSIGTVREAVSSLAHEGLVTRRRGSGTFVAEFRKAQQHIAILMDRDISHPKLSYSHRRVSQTLLRFFEDHGQPVRRYTGRKLPWEHDGEPTCPDFLSAVDQNQVRAVIVVNGLSHPRWAEPLRRRNIPIVGAWDGSTHVVPDYADMVRQAVNYLYEHGRRRIARLGWLAPVYPEPTGANEAFERRLRELNLPVRAEWNRHDIHPATIGAGWQQFREIWTSFREKPDGLIVADDILWRDAASAVLELGIQVPDRLMIVTHANRGSGLFCPVAAIHMETDPDDIARELGEMTLRRLAGEMTGDAVKRIGFRWIETRPADETIPTASVASSSKSNREVSPRGVAQSYRSK